ncbi:MAG: peptidase C45 [Planctomycetes bacterium]|nr:peptidase C45 [Planctomycetota bacterium]
MKTQLLTAGLTSTLALALLLGAPQTAQAEVVAREGKGFLEKRADGNLVLHVSGTPYEMGFQHGRLLKKQVKQNLTNIVDNQTKMGKSDTYQAYVMMRPLMHSMLRPNIPKRYLEEMRGVAEGAGLEYDMVEAGNLFPAAFHCSGIALQGKATADGSLYHVRILDYMTKLGLQDTALVIKHAPKGRKRWLNVGFAGFIGTVTGMNESKVAIGEMGGKGLGHWNGMPMPLLMREALETASTMEEAVEIFRKAKRTCEYYYVISDGKTNRSTGIWCTEKVFETILPGQTFTFIEKAKLRRQAAGGKAFGKDVKVTVDKHSILIKGAKGLQTFVAMPPKDSLIMSGPHRYAEFARRLSANYGKVDAKLLQEMVKRPVSMKSNLHVAIFHPETLEVWVAIAGKDGTPACDMPYAKYTLKSSTASK